MKYYSYEDKIHRIGLPAARGLYGNCFWLFYDSHHRINGIYSNKYDGYSLYGKYIRINIGRLVS